MPRNSSNAERESEDLKCTELIRAAISEKHGPLLRSIAVLVAKTGRNVRWPEVMETASEVLHEAVQQALKHAESFDPTRSAAAWVRGIAARILSTRRRADNRLLRCIPQPFSARRAWATAAQKTASPGPLRLSGRRSRPTLSKHSLAFPPKSGGPSNSATTRAWTE